MSAKAFHGLLRYLSTATEDDVPDEHVDTSSLWIMCLDAPVESVVKCLAEKKTYGDNFQKVYTDRYEKLVPWPMEHLTRNERPFVES